MAWNWIAIIARTVPWADLARRTPAIIAASRKLLNSARETKVASHRAPHHPPDLQELNDRIAALEQRDEEQARVVTQMVEQLQRITDGLEVLAARNRLLLWLVGTLAVALAVTLSFVVRLLKA